jgi:hypothetical protein
MELKHQLETPLKRLRLSGVLESLQVRTQQAIDGQWSYIEFLSRLLEDEVARREHKQLTLRVRRATINTAKTLEAFDFNFNPTLNRQRVLDLASGEYVRAYRNVLLCGPTGVGKSHLAQGLATKPVCRASTCSLSRPTRCSSTSTAGAPMTPVTGDCRPISVLTCWSWMTLACVLCPPLARKTSMMSSMAATSGAVSCSLPTAPPTSGLSCLVTRSWLRLAWTVYFIMLRCW